MIDVKLPGLEEVEAAIGPLHEWGHQCHAASVQLVRSGLLGESRVARGWCSGVAGQHSWAVVGDDCYDPEATIVDVTLWSYQDVDPYVWTGSLETGLHEPHGWRNGLSIWKWGRPPYPKEEPISLRGAEKLSGDAKLFLRLLGPLDRAGWGQLADIAPVTGWPAGEILAAMDDTPELGALVPIDKLGMLTDRNPGGLYR